MTPVRFAPEVPDELAEAALWYEARRQGLGAEFLHGLQNVDPMLEIRRALLPRFPYALVFLVREEELRVLGRRARQASTGVLVKPRPTVRTLGHRRAALDELKGPASG